jgi:signal recognition particle subunit SRP54
MAKDFTLDDFRQQLDQLQKMGGWDAHGRLLGLSEMIPKEEDRNLALSRIHRMVDAMTEEERKDPDLITSSSVSRIAASSGTQPLEVAEFLGQFQQVRTLMHQMAKMSLWERLKMMMGFGKVPGQGGEAN